MNYEFVFRDKYKNFKYFIDECLMEGDGTMDIVNKIGIYSKDLKQFIRHRKSQLKKRFNDYRKDDIYDVDLDDNYIYSISEILMLS